MLKAKIKVFSFDQDVAEAMHEEQTASLKLMEYDPAVYTDPTG